jgi:hypothetical protein
LSSSIVLKEKRGEKKVQNCSPVELNQHQRKLCAQSLSAIETILLVFELQCTCSGSFEEPELEQGLWNQ